MIDVIGAIKQAKNIALFTHINPDGDALGCICAMHLALKQLGKTSTMYCDGTVPKTFTHLSCRDQINNGDLQGEHDLFFSMDASSLDRIGKYAQAFKAAPISAQIDHHPTNTMFATANFIDANKASCAEIAYDLLQELSITITAEIAASLLGGIYTDTGAFCNGNTNQNSFLVAAKLVGLCPNLSEMTFQLFKRRTQKEFLLLKKVLQESMFCLDNKLFIMVILHSMLEDMDATDIDTSYIVGSTGMVDGVLINLFIHETDKNIFKMSFRSTGNINVSNIAKNLGGGGHKNASGCSLMGSYHSVYNQVIAECQKEIARCKLAESSC